MNILKCCYSVNGKLLLDRKGIDCIPIRQYDDDAGYDLRAAILETKTLPVGNEIHKIPLGVCLDLKSLSDELKDSKWKLAAKISVRSGTPGYRLNNQIGLIDTGYTGELIAKMYNGTDEELYINPGDRIAQMTLELVMIPAISVVSEIDVKTDRGSNGFNSTGK